MTNAGTVLFVGDNQWKCDVSPQGELVETCEGRGVARSLTRTWCLFELHLAMLKIGVSIEVALPRDADSRDEEPPGFMASICSMPDFSLGADSFPSNIEDLPIDVTKAQATNPDDKIKIDGIIANGVGAERMNEQVKQVVFDSHKTAVLAEHYAKKAQRGVYKERLKLPTLWGLFLAGLLNCQYAQWGFEKSIGRIKLEYQYHGVNRVWPRECYEAAHWVASLCMHHYQL